MRRLLITIVAMVVVLAGCNDGGSSGPRRIPISAEDGGSTIDVAVGDELLIELEANPSTGFTWTLEAGDVAVVAPRGEPTFASESNLPGSGGLMTWNFEAMAAGSTKVELAYRQPWDTEAEPERWFTFTVDVREP